MNKTLLIVVVIAGVIILGAGSFFLMNSSKPGSSSQTQTAASSEKTSLKGLLQSNTNQECAFTDPETGSNGTVYIGAGKMRGDFNSEVNGQATTSHMVSDNEIVHVWIDGTASGYKMTMTTIDTATGEQKAVDINKPVNYECKPWSPQADKFVLPENVTFQDMSQMMDHGSMVSPATSEAGSVDTTASCATCDALPEGAKAQCKTALKCS